MHETAHFSSMKAAPKLDYVKLARKYGVALLGTAGSWCLFDITFYANGLFAATVLNILGIGKISTPSPPWT